MGIHNFNLEGEIKAKLEKLSAADDHPTIAVAERAVFAAKDFLARLLEIRQFHRTQECDDLINGTRDLLSDLVGRAVAKEEDNRVNGSFYRAIDAANLRRGY